MSSIEKTTGGFDRTIQISEFMSHRRKSRTLWFLSVVCGIINLSYRKTDSQQEEQFSHGIMKGGGEGVGHSWGQRNCCLEMAPCYSFLISVLNVELNFNGPGIWLLLLNARSVCNKASLIHDFIMDEKDNLACISEIIIQRQHGINFYLF